MSGIKELKEAIEGLEIIAVGVARVMSNGKIGTEDLSILFDLLKDVEKIKAAFSGLGEIPEEAKDLDEAELIELSVSAFNIIRKVRLALG
ncbi:hypothetical protein KAU11_04470 [Candidatus Babeliales bacterium]|nr:hypothetical protein [Candidatus Babeliales bacterium]